MCDVVVLDDDLLVRVTVAELLRDDGLVVREAGTGAEALSVLREYEDGKVQVLVADRDLGGLSGTSDGFRVAVEALRERPGLKVIYASGGVDAVPGRAPGPRERVLPKPFPPSRLVRLVRELLGPQQV